MKAMIPTVDFFGAQVSRLFLGDNPINGHSYIPNLHTGEEMMDYFTAQTTVEALFEAERLGYTTCLPLANGFMLRVIRQYRNEGGKINWIFQPYPPHCRGGQRPPDDDVRSDCDVPPGNDDRRAG